MVRLYVAGAIHNKYNYPIINTPKEINNMMLFLEIDETQGKALLERLSNWSEIRVVKDLAERDRYIVARR